MDENIHQINAEAVSDYLKIPLTEAFEFNEWCADNDYACYDCVERYIHTPTKKFVSIKHLFQRFEITQLREAFSDMKLLSDLF